MNVLFSGILALSLYRHDVYSPKSAIMIVFLYVADGWVVVLRCLIWTISLSPIVDKGRFILSLELFSSVDSMLSVWIGSVVRIVWNYIAVLLWPGLFFGSASNEALPFTDRWVALAWFLFSECLGSLALVPCCLCRIWCFFSCRDSTLRCIWFCS